ncbi:MAG: hypothetical protein LBS59_02050 [Puniceicoccales bacterium]|jgi:hypothetical protein|nr:hypothetical protein [Puniceicoccales bacterium]
MNRLWKFGAATCLSGALNFVSQTDWIIGDTTSNNTTFSGTATVTATAKAVYIGKSEGASGNTTKRRRKEERGRRGKPRANSAS